MPLRSGVPSISQRMGPPNDHGHLAFLWARKMQLFCPPRRGKLGNVYEVYAHTRTFFSLSLGSQEPFHSVGNRVKR